LIDKAEQHSSASTAVGQLTLMWVTKTFFKQMCSEVNCPMTWI